MIVSNRRHSRFGQKLCDRNPKRHMHGYRHSILHNKEVYLVFLYEPIETRLYCLHHFVNPPRDLLRSVQRLPDLSVDPHVLRMLKKSLRHQQALIFRDVQFPRKPERFVSEVA